MSLTAIWILCTWIICGFLNYGLMKGFWRNFYIDKQFLKYDWGEELFCWFLAVLGLPGLICLVVDCVFNFKDWLRYGGFCLKIPKEYWETNKRS